MVINITALYEGGVWLRDVLIFRVNCFINDPVIGAGTVINPNCVIDGAPIGDAGQVGQFDRIRPRTALDSTVRVGNFVETKNSHIGTGSKASHLTYLGDTEIGRDVNVGAGTITCNYDGVAKHKTRIGDGAFIGSNTSLVAPVEIDENAQIGAGSTITKPVPKGSVAIGRGRQRNSADWKGKA